MLPDSDTFLKASLISSSPARTFTPEGGSIAVRLTTQPLSTFTQQLHEDADKLAMPDGTHLLLYIGYRWPVQRGYVLSTRLCVTRAQRSHSV